MGWNKEQIAYREKTLATGLFAWKHKNLYAFKDLEDFLKSPEKFNERLKSFDLSIGHIPIGGWGLLTIDIGSGFIEIPKNTENTRLLLKYRNNLRNWFAHDHYMLSDEYFDDLKRRLNKKGR